MLSSYHVHSQCPYQNIYTQMRVYTVGIACWSGSKTQLRKCVWCWTACRLRTCTAGARFDGIESMSIGIHVILYVISRRSPYLCTIQCNRPACGILNYTHYILHVTCIVVTYLAYMRTFRRTCTRGAEYVFHEYMLSSTRVSVTLSDTSRLIFQLTNLCAKHAYKSVPYMHSMLGPPTGWPPDVSPVLLPNTSRLLWG